ncbi:hypothetical protein BDV27DRAFT_122146 [Aspergillus caelatus]|uniref:Uncharacterized protein n=1 Tax=Aspergillus caelatus TaxID=61420 RepID=A0A5N7AFK7_9EURO|nr:uncharacterized protein BDV27DRAFT_122146 [Aspergillus caelatus]KAE8368505.1 hypothetical protein BDV27DRAFT_122146 [Aspergillus caelatus]
MINLSLKIGTRDPAPANPMCNPQPHTSFLETAMFMNVWMGKASIFGKMLVRTTPGLFIEILGKLGIVPGSSHIGSIGHEEKCFDIKEAGTRWQKQVSNWYQSAEAWQDAYSAF